MRTRLAKFARRTAQGKEAEDILRRCIHCGFCAPSCATYRQLGNEVDSPRGRIYLIKSLLEGDKPGAGLQGSLERCLGCRACETACPSGVQYSRLLEIGKGLLAKRRRRSWRQVWLRWAMRLVLPYAKRFALVLALFQRLGRLRAKLPEAWQSEIPEPAKPALPWPEPRHARRVILLSGCVQPVLAPNIDAASARVLDRLGISCLSARRAGCCGGLSRQLDAPAQSLAFMRRNIDAWWPLLEQGAEAIVANASGCGVLVKDYGHHLRHDSAYAGKAARVSAACKDIGELLAAENLDGLAIRSSSLRVAFQSPCTLQHGQRLEGVVEGVLKRLGFNLVPVADTALCCGAAGTYALLQPELSQALRAAKLKSLQHNTRLQCIATANIGCLSHLQGGTELPVRHWIELLDAALNAPQTQFGASSK